MGSVLEQFTLSVTERIQLVSACAAEPPHTRGCLLCAAKNQQRMGAPGAACAAQKGLELHKSQSALGSCGSGEGTFVKTQQFVNTRAEVLMENQSLFRWLLYILRGR